MVKAVLDYSAPQDVPSVSRVLQEFLGIAGYYCPFISGFLEIAKPLNRLTRKHERFFRDEECQSSFLELRRRLASAPVMYILDSLT